MSEIYGSSVGLKQACRTGACRASQRNGLSSWPMLASWPNGSRPQLRKTPRVSHPQLMTTSATGSSGATCATWAIVPARCRATRSRFSLDDHGEGPRPGMVPGPFVAGSGGASSVP